MASLRGSCTTAVLAGATGLSSLAIRSPVCKRVGAWLTPYTRIAASRKRCYRCVIPPRFGCFRWKTSAELYACTELDAVASSSPASIASCRMGRASWPVSAGANAELDFDPLTPRIHRLTRFGTGPGGRVGSRISTPSDTRRRGASGFASARRPASETIRNSRPNCARS